MYKPNQGIIARVSLTVSLVLLVLYLCYGIYERFVLNLLPFSIGSYPITWGHIGSLVLFLVLFPIIIYYNFYHQKTVDFLIEVEGEMRRVTWPAYKPFSLKTELWRSTAVVIITMVVLGVFICIVDIIIDKIMWVVL